MPAGNRKINNGVSQINNGERSGSDTPTTSIGLQVAKATAKFPMGPNAKALMKDIDKVAALFVPGRPMCYASQLRVVIHEPDMHLNTLKAKLKELQGKPDYELSAAAMTAPTAIGTASRKKNKNSTETAATETTATEYGGPIQRTVWDLNTFQQLARDGSATVADLYHVLHAVTDAAPNIPDGEDVLRDWCNKVLKDIQDQEKKGSKSPGKNKRVKTAIKEEYSGSLAEELTEQTVLNRDIVWLKGKPSAFPINLATDQRKVTVLGVYLQQYPKDKEDAMKAEAEAKSKEQKEAHSGKRK